MSLAAVLFLSLFLCLTDLVVGLRECVNERMNEQSYPIILVHLRVYVSFGLNKS